MNVVKSFQEFLNESFLFEAKKELKFDELDLPQRNDWVEKTIFSKWDKENGGELEKAKAEVDKLKDPDEIAKAEKKVEELTAEITEKIKKDKKYGKRYTEYLKKNDRYYEILDKVNKAGGPEKFKKENPKEYDEILDLHSENMSPFTLTKRPGGVLQITSQDMDGGDDTGELGAEAFRKKMKEYIDKNGKPKGVIMDLRANTGGSQETAKGMTDFFVDQDKYTIEQQRYATATRRFRDLPYPEGLEKALEYTGEQKIKDVVKNMSEDEKKKYWEESKKNGDLSYQNDRENKVDAKYRFGNVPVVVQTSIRTFSAGEFASDTIKNLHPNAVHVGHNSGGGANQTFEGLIDDEKNNKDKSSTEKAKLAAKAYKLAYWNEEDGKKIHDAILAKIKSGEITDDMDVDKVAELVQQTGRDTVGDDHIECITDDGNIMPMVPQVKSDRVIVDPKTKKPVLKDGKMEFKGNWEHSGVGMGKTSPFVESDPDTATKDALEFIYKKNKDEKLLKELNTDPAKFGLGKDGKDGLFDSSSLSKQSAFVRSGNKRQSDQLEKSKETAKENQKNDKTIADQLIKAESDFRGDEGEKKSIDDVGAKMLFQGLPPKTQKLLKIQPVEILLPNKRKKQIKRETLMDFVMIDRADPVEIAMVKAQMAEYAYINKIRVDHKLKPLMDFNLWQDRKFELYKDNKEYRQRLDAKRRKAMAKQQKAVKENLVLSFEDFLAENFKKNYGQKMTVEEFEKIEKDSEVLFRGVRYYVEENTGVTLVLKPVKGGNPISVNLNMFSDFGAINESYKRPSATTKISGEYEITIDAKIVNTRIAGFERENDSEDSLYFMDNDPLRDTIGSLTVKNSDMPKLEKGTIIKAKSSKNGKEIQIKRIGDL